MTQSIKFVALLGLILGVAACATVNEVNSPSAQIQYAPAIDVPYSEVIDNVKQHLGVNVRWGGQIIGARDVDEITRVTIMAYPLSSDGEPTRRLGSGFDGGRFIVEMDNFHDRINSRFITIYGPISGEETLTNGNKQITIPVVTAIETEDWKQSSPRYSVELRHGFPYHGLGFRYGYYDRYGYYGNFSYGLDFGFYPFAYVGRGHHRGRHH